MRRLLLIVASVAFVLVGNVSSLGQAACNSQQGTPGNRTTQDETPCDSGDDEEDAHTSKRTVTLQAIIRPSGKAEVVKVLKVTPKDLPKEVADDLVKKCIEAVKKLKFASPMKDGRPASQHATIVFNFGNEEKADQQK